MNYLEQRIYKEMDVAPERCNVKIRIKTKHSFEEKELPIFTSTDDDDIKIMVYTLNRELITVQHPNADPEHKSIYNDREKDYYLIRNNPKKVAEGKPRYLMPKGAGIYPFLPPTLIEKWEEKKDIETLVLTEGFFKAFKASLHGWDIVGFSSITHFADSKTKVIHEDVQRILIDCKVKNVVMLYDGDCLDISTKDLAAGKDLAKRPQTFLNSMLQIRELLTDFDVNIYFSHINSEHILPNKPKGLDDLLIDKKGLEDSILADFLKLGISNGMFFKLNVSSFVRKLQPYFNLKSAEQFYSAWSEIIKEREFVFFGSTYQVNNDGKLERTVPKELKNFIRVGDDYYEMVNKPDATGKIEPQLMSRKKSTIADDFGSKCFKHIPKFKTFINLPSNTNYQRIIHNCYNIYNPFSYEPEEGDWSSIETFIKHIFGEQFQLGLDYIQLLYQYPTETLPILCLVSKERKTGKSTFLNFLKKMFGENALNLGSQEFQTQFNSLLTKKLIVGVDETSLDKNRDITERLKMLSTAKKVISEAKGKDQIEVDTFTKYILCSNFETNFIYTQEEETRFWVRKVPQFKTEQTDFLERMTDEIPSFIHFLNNRKISTPKKTRMWFDEKLIETEALLRLKEEQKPRNIKLIEQWLKETFEDYKLPTITITESQLIERIPALKKYEASLRTVLLNNLKCDVTRDKNGKASPHRYKLPRMQVTLEGPQIVWDSYHCRAFVFDIKDYLSDKEIISIWEDKKEEITTN